MYLQIVSTWRSGTTFLGDLLMTPQATFYHYEPLWPYGVKRFRNNNETGTVEVVNKLHQLFSCNYTNMSMFIILLKYTVITIHFYVIIFHQRFVNKILQIIYSGLYIKTAQEQPFLFQLNTRLWERGCGKGNLNLINNK